MGARASRRLQALLLILVTTGGVAACSRGAPWSGAEWTPESGEPPPQPTSLSEEAERTRLGTQKIEFRAQSVNGLPIEGSYIKTVTEGDHPLWIKSQFLTADKLPRAADLRQELKRKDYVMQRLDRLQARFHCVPKASSTTTAVRWKRAWQVVYKRLCETTGGEAYELVVNSRGRLVSREPAGAQLAPAPSVPPPMTSEAATLYPRGPKISTLKTLSLNVAATPGFLFNRHVEVVSDTGYTFSVLGQLPQVGPSEERFDMLQAYYFASEALNWIATRFQYDASGLRIRTHVGYPEHNNVAFYFNREIRIGIGDDVAYSRMALDPSIVIHETMHGVIEPLTHLPFNGEGGSLQEGLADTLTAFYLDNPNIGETSYKIGPYQRTLANDMRYVDRTGALYHDSLALSGLLWEIHERVDAATAESVVQFLLARLAPSSGFEDARAQLTAWMIQAPDQDQARKVEAVARRRNWL
jgi:hypothetical protein